MLPFKDGVKFLLDADDSLEHKMTLELIKGVALDLELCRVALYPKEPRPSLPVDLKSELEQVAKSSKWSFLRIRVSLPCMCLH